MIDKYVTAEYKNIEKFCKKNALISYGDSIIIGLSGGADSVGLFLFLIWMKKKYDLDLCAVHVNHGIRGEVADDDEIFVKKLANDNQIECLVFREDIPTYAKEKGIGEEEAGRIRRYEIFEQVRKCKGFQHIAVAHQRQDQSETVLFQILRGSGLKGVCGIRPKQGKIIRPLLDTDRCDIEKTLTILRQEWREDETNRETDYTRNKIRNIVIPYLEKEIVSESGKHLAELAHKMQSLSDMVSEDVENWIKENVVKNDDVICFYAERFMAARDGIKPYISLRVMEMCCGKRKDITKKHIDGFVDIASGETGRSLDMPYEMKIYKEYEKVYLRNMAEKNERKKIDTTINGEYILEVTDRKNLPPNIPKNSCTKWFDYAKIKGVPVWRYPQNGDKMYINTQGMQKKLSRMMIDAKVPLSERESMLLLADDENILWCPELDRVNMLYYVDEYTDKVLVVSKKEAE